MKVDDQTFTVDIVSQAQKHLHEISTENNRSIVFQESPTMSHNQFNGPNQMLLFSAARNRWRKTYKTATQLTWITPSIDMVLKWWTSSIKWNWMFRLWCDWSSFTNSSRSYLLMDFQVGGQRQNTINKYHVGFSPLLFASLLFYSIKTQNFVKKK